MNHVTAKADPLQRVEGYTYDLGGMTSTFTDRKGQVRSYTIDGIGRPTVTAFGVQSGSGGTTAQSTISFTYDAGNRLTQATDSSFGVVTRTYDSLGHVLTETTPQGSISYTYDNAGRRTTMQVAGQQQVIYTWDNANRLTGIGQGTKSVGFTYDNLNRRSTATLPNGIVATYSYDADSHLIGIDYTAGGGAIGNLTYAYDSVGRRSNVGGSLAAINLPVPVASASYDAANELTNWNGVGLIYDPNGSMVTDGLHAYSWDARHQLASIDSGGTATFTYDPFGRRTGKSITGVASTGFLFDGVNSVQEIASGTPSANLMVGNTDENFLRTDSSGSSTFLADALGSTIALADASGAVQTRYTYDPFGATSQHGVSTTNTSAYTGRELDVAGLYYYRARYYDPGIDRFISEDPSGFEGGINLYQYAGDSPLNYVDPLGLTITVNGSADPFGIGIAVNGSQVDYQTAINYLSRAPGMAAILHDLDIDLSNYNINFNNKDDDSYDPTTHTINWDPHSALRCTSGGSQSPALGLGHEMSHADEPSYWKLIDSIPWGDYQNLEEWRVITGPETDAAHTLGEGTRTDHGGVPYRVPTPIAR
jgi:RHS repeat-associated protein